MSSYSFARDKGIETSINRFNCTSIWLWKRSPSLDLPLYISLLYHVFYKTGKELCMLCMCLRHYFKKVCYSLCYFECEGLILFFMIIVAKGLIVINIFEND